MKILMQYDSDFGNFSGCDPEKLVQALFYDTDKCGENPDVILWESHSYLPQECESNTFDSCTYFSELGIDMMQRLIDETHKRGMKAYWHHRFCEVDFGPGNAFRKVPAENTVKKEHPDWLIRTWYEPGLWNLTIPALQDFKIAYIRKFANKYNFDGMCIDFLRHLPCLPPGAQWEHRDAVTEFMQKVRSVIPAGMKLGAKVPENAAACRVDGFDVEQWVKNGSVDFLIAGSRSISSDVAWYKSITAGTGIEVYPCWDTWHSSDACHWREDDFYRGVFANWRAEKADGIVGFNYLNTPAEVQVDLICHTFAALYGQKKPWITREFPDFFRQVKGSADDTLSRTYAVERRGGYPYGTGAGGNNVSAPLPAMIRTGKPAEISLRLYDRRESVTAHILISGTHEADAFTVQINDIPLSVESFDPAYMDALIHYPKPQPPSGAGYCYTDSPSPLLMLTVPVPPSAIRCGENIFTVQCTLDADIHMERLEVTIS